MSKTLIAVFMIVAALGLSVGNAEAARMGGGKSVGMQRQAVAPRPVAPTQQATPAPAAGAPAAAAAPKRNWMGPLAGIAAGMGIYALLSHFGLGEGMANFMMIALLLMAGLMIFKLIFRRSSPNSPQREPAMQYAGAGRSVHDTPPQTAVGAGLASAPASVSVPAGFDTAEFLRIAKLNFVRLQASNDAKSVDDIREFTSPELFAEIRLQMDERGDALQLTEVVTLNAELLEVTTEANRHIASVHFSGMIREAVGGTAEPFDEIWHLSKPAEGGAGWVISGIQQTA
jgi:predicted lipid-binding transport protein (Tim44 family)